MIGKGIRVFAAASGIALASTACAQAPEEPVKAPVQVGTIYSAKATAKSHAELGVSRWHSTVEPGKTNAYTIDGSDNHGVVKYLASTFLDVKTKTVHIQSILPQRGDLVWNYETKTVVANTIPDSAARFAKAIYYDYQLAHPIHGARPYGFGFSPYTALGIGAVLVIGGGLLTATGVGGPIGGYIATVGFGIVGNAAYAILTTPPETAAQPTAAQDTQTPAQTPNEIVNQEFQQLEQTVNQVDPNAAPQQQPDGQQTQQPSDGQQTQPQPDGQQTPPNEGTPTNNDGSTPLPAENNGGNLDNVGSEPGGSSTSSSSSSSGSADQPAGTGGDQPAGTGSEQGGSSGGSEGAGGGGGGGGGESEASNICRKVAVSHVTGVRACLVY